MMLRPLSVSLFAALLLGACATSHDGPAAPTRDAVGLIAFLSTTTSQDASAPDNRVSVIDADGTGQKELTSGSRADLGGPIWSPDGSQIAFESSSGQHTSISVMRADGSGLTTSPDAAGAGGLGLSPVWSPDGSKIAFDTLGKNGFDLYVVSPDGTGLKKLAEGGSPSWSPDGKQIAFLSTPAKVSPGAKDTVNIIEADGIQPTVLASATEILDVSWAPAGSKVAYLAGSTNHDTVLTLADAVTGQKEPIGDFTGAGSLTWSPDGSKIAIGSISGITVVDAAGKDPIRLPGAGNSPTWSADSKMIAFVSGSAVRSQLYVVDANGSGLKKLTTTADESGYPDWQPSPR